MNRKQTYTLYFETLRNRVIAKRLHLPTPVYGLRNIIFAVVGYLIGLLLIGKIPEFFTVIWFYIITVELGYISHDLLHQQYFRSTKWNNFASYITANLLIGLSRSWWIQKHNNEHHNYTNSDIHDTDIRDYDEIFTENPGKFPFFHRNKRILFWFATTLLYFNLIFLSYRHIVSQKKYLEGICNVFSLCLMPFMLMLHFGFAHGLILLVSIYVLVGIHLAFAFMVNHIGMQVLDGKTMGEYAWLDLQTKTSRNIIGGVFVNHFFGGLNKQIEHHIFPKISRKNISAVSDEVKSFCMERNISYHEVSFSQSLKEISRTLNTGETV